MDFLVELPTGLVLNFSIVLVALDHLAFSLADDVLEDLLQQQLFIFGSLFHWTAFRLRSLGRRFVVLLSRLVCVEEVQQFGEGLDVDGLEESIVVVFELFLSFLDEGLVGAAEQLPRREHRQFVFVLGLFAVDMQVTHVAKPFLEGPVLVLLGLVDLS